MKYCLTHNIWLPNSSRELVNCLMVTSTPPELPVDWLENLSEPDAYELELMNQSAFELEAQFIGE